MKVIKVQKQKQGYFVTTEDKKEYSIPYIKGTFLYKETKAFIDGGGTIEPEFTEKELQDQEAFKQKQQKEKALNELQVTVNSVDLDANIQSIAYMGVVTTLGIYRTLKEEFEFVSNELENMEESDPLYKFYTMKRTSYIENFKGIKLSWKNAENNISSVQVETITEGLAMVMTEIGSIVTGEVQNV